MELAINEDIVIGAEMIKQLYDKYVELGFTEEQSMELIKASLSVTGKK